MNKDNHLTAFMFFESKALQSGRVVNLLRNEYPEIQEAAAVYSETDVIGRVSAPKERLGTIILDLMQQEIRDNDTEHGIDTMFRIDAVQSFLVTGKVTFQKENPSEINENVCAYVIVQTERNQGTQPQVLRGLATCEGVVYTAALVANNDIMVKVQAPNKVSFDNKIMAQIQAIPGVKTTQSFIIINNMHFVRTDSSMGVGVNETIDPLQNISAWAMQRK